MTSIETEDKVYRTHEVPKSFRSMFVYFYYSDIGKIIKWLGLSQNIIHVYIAHIKYVS